MLPYDQKILHCCGQQSDPNIMLYISVSSMYDFKTHYVRIEVHAVALFEHNEFQKILDTDCSREELIKMFSDVSQNNCYNSRTFRVLVLQGLVFLAGYIVGAFVASL